ncbi:hypothetical protein ACTXT7_007283 [Hymenolepis weldensis]
MALVVTTRKMYFDSLTRHNLAAEDDDDEIIARPSRPSPRPEECNESQRQETLPDEVPDVSILDPSSPNFPPSQLSRVQKTVSVSVEEEMEEDKRGNEPTIQTISGGV